VFPSNDAALIRLAGRVAERLPELGGGPVVLQRHPGLRDKRGPVHAASFLRERRIAFDCTVREFPRIFVHELFHFVWLRAGNARRWSYERLLAAEIRSGARGELGWSAEWRKLELTRRDAGRRTRRWREYCCESFCDSAAWLYSGIGRHPEFTLPQGCRKRRREWFARELESGPLSI
jgi:transposase InsO family protein